MPSTKKIVVTSWLFLKGWILSFSLLVVLLHSMHHPFNEAEVSLFTPFEMLSVAQLELVMKSVFKWDFLGSQNNFGHHIRHVNDDDFILAALTCPAAIPPALLSYSLLTLELPNLPLQIL